MALATSPSPWKVPSIAKVVKEGMDLPIRGSDCAGQNTSFWPELPKLPTPATQSPKKTNPSRDFPDQSNQEQITYNNGSSYGFNFTLYCKWFANFLLLTGPVTVPSLIRAYRETRTIGIVRILPVYPTKEFSSLNVRSKHLDFLKLVPKLLCIPIMCA